MASVHRRDRTPWCWHVAWNVQPGVLGAQLTRRRDGSVTMRSARALARRFRGFESGTIAMRPALTFPTLYV